MPRALTADYYIIDKMAKVYCTPRTPKEVHCRALRELRIKLHDRLEVWEDGKLIVWPLKKNCKRKHLWEKYFD